MWTADMTPCFGQTPIERREHTARHHNLTTPPAFADELWNQLDERPILPQPSNPQIGRLK